MVLGGISACTPCKVCWQFCLVSLSQLLSFAPCAFCCIRPNFYFELYICGVFVEWATVDVEDRLRIIAVSLHLRQYFATDVFVKARGIGIVVSGTWFLFRLKKELMNDLTSKLRIDEVSTPTVHLFLQTTFPRKTRIFCCLTYLKTSNVSLGLSLKYWAYSSTTSLEYDAKQIFWTSMMIVYCTVHTDAILLLCSLEF